MKKPKRKTKKVKKEKFQKAAKKKPVAAGKIVAPDALRKKIIGKRFVFTSAQNNTYVHEGFLTALESFCKDQSAELIVSRFTYNKSGFQNDTKDNEDLWYDPKLAKYLKDDSIQITKDLIFCGELDVLPTAENPLSGFDNYCRSASGIIPHAKVAMKSLPGMKEDGARFLYTTGAVTKRNYIQRKAGQKADFHHVFGALIVEIDTDGEFHVRQIVADKTGAFYDLTNKYEPDGAITRDHSVEGINWGDIHIEKTDDSVYKASFEDSPDSILNQLKPKNQFVHDLSDFSARNHHNIKDPHFLADQFFNQKLSVEKGLTLAAQFLKAIERKGTKTVVVESNHDLAYRRWLKEADIRFDPENARFYHESNAQVYKEIEGGNTHFNIFAWALKNKEDLKNVVFLQEDDSFVICKDKSGGIECGIHGHIGPNGARGSPKNLRKIGRKVNTGHTHSAGIIDGVYTAGVSAKLDMDYNKGPSSWSHSHIVTYPNGKRSIITVKNGKWRS